MSEGSTIPELLGFKSVPFERQNKYSPKSYRAMYALLQDEAKDIHDSYSTHWDIDAALSLRYVNDTSYRRRVNEAKADITAVEPSRDIARLMERMMDGARDG